MNTHSILHQTRLAVVLALCMFAAAAAGAADAPTFLKPGKSYRLVIPFSSRDDVRPRSPVKILENGGGGWFFVEYSVLENHDGKNELMPIRTWLNFAYVTTATEEAENPEETKATPKKKP